MIIRSPLETEVVVVVPGAAIMRRHLDELGASFTLGQDPTNALAVADTFVSSGRHCAFQRTPEGLRLDSFGHPNGEHIDGIRVQGSRLLQVGDRIAIGKTTILFMHRLTGRAGVASPLLAAVLADPDDDRVRLAYAAWLRQQRDPRGEFIEQQCRGGARAVARSSALLARHELAWLSPLPVPIESWTFAGGFVSDVVVGPTPLTAAEERSLRAAHPVRTLTVRPIV